MRLRVISMAGVELEAEVDYASLPAEDGSLGILKNHAPLMAVLKQGELVYDEGGQRKKYSVAAGLATVEDNDITILL